ncbi:MAG TPA: UbiA family prenyltransferase [Candidatus Acidoferrales bacterium]|nr:UbiA family prenyltransferase [Candidatus Acidoferrales bacterium]
MSQVSIGEVLFGHAAPAEPTLKNRIIGFVELQRPAIIVLPFFPLVFSTAALAGARLDDPRWPIGLVMVYLLTAANLIINDLGDAERDQQKWPQRPLATGLISKNEATLYVFILTGISFAIALLVFNWLSAAIIVLVFVTHYIYARYTRDHIGYLTVVVPAGIIPLAVWAAISPGTILTPVPWLLVALRVFYDVGLNTANEATDQVSVKPFLVRVKPFMEKVDYSIGVLASLVIGILLIVYAQLSWLYLTVLVVTTVCALTAVKSVGTQRSPEAVGKNIMTFVISMAISLLGLAAFAWIK